MDAVPRSNLNHTRKALAWKSDHRQIRSGFEIPDLSSCGTNLTQPHQGHTRAQTPSAIASLPNPA